MSVINLNNESKLQSETENAGSRALILITQREIEFSPTSSSRNTPEFSMQINVSMLCYVIARKHGTIIGGTIFSTEVTRVVS